VDNTSPSPTTDATLEATENAALGVLGDLFQVALALRELTPGPTTTTPADIDRDRLAITEEFARLTVECLPNTVLDLIIAVRGLRRLPPPWTIDHPALQAFTNAHGALWLSRRRLDDSVDMLSRAAPATGSLIADAARHARTITEATVALLGF
jgi:hypothetical protein